MIFSAMVRLPHSSPYSLTHSEEAWKSNLYLMICIHRPGIAICGQDPSFEILSLGYIGKDLSVLVPLKQTCMKVYLKIFSKVLLRPGEVSKFNIFTHTTITSKSR